MLFDFFLIGLMILLNGIFAMAEMAMIATQPTRLRAMVKRGEQKASRLLAIRENPGDFLATIQIGITLAGTTASVIGGAEAVRFLSPIFSKNQILAPYAQEIALGLVVVLIAYLSLVCGELIPKRLALRNAEKTALALSRPIDVFSRLAYIPMRFLSFSSNLVLRLFGNTSPEDLAISLEEIELSIKQGASDGVILPFEERLLYRVIDYADKNVSDVMTPRMGVISLDVETSMVEALEKAKLSGFSRFPVFEQQIDGVIGYVHIKDLIRGIDKGINLRQCLRDTVFIPTSVPLSEAFSRLTKSRKHMAIVLDEYGGVNGLLTIEDLLEVVFGEIDDEHSPVVHSLIQKSDHEWSFPGDSLVTELAELLKVEFQPRGKYRSIAGFIMTELGRIPSEGDQLSKFGYLFTVRKMDHLRIVEVNVSRNH